MKTRSSKSIDSRKVGSGIRLSSQSAVVVALSIYFAGLLSGSWLCSVSTISDSLDAREGSVRREIQSISRSNPKLSGPTAHVPSKERVPRISMKPSELWSPTPIIVMGMMKAGTTSIYGYFNCGIEPGSAELSHYDCKPGNDPQEIGMSCGKRMRRNLTKNKKPAFHTMDHFTLYAEIDAQENNGGMTLPQLSYLEEIYDNFPEATWILNLRDAKSWLSSINRWKDLRQRFIDNPYPPLLPKGKGESDAEMIEFYMAQAEQIRRFCGKHPSITLVEVQIDSESAGQVMEDAFGISKQCWGNRNANDGNAIWKDT